MKKISRSTPTVAESSGQNFLSSPLRNAPVREISFEEATIPSQYPHRLSLYQQAPSYEITIEDFEELALARLERNTIKRSFFVYFLFVVLKAVETAGIRNLRDDDLFAWIRKYEQKHLPLHGNNVASRFPLFDERRRDESAHFILRLAFCGAVPQDTFTLDDSRTLVTAEDGRRWFVNQETALLRYRLQMLTENRSEREEFLSHCLRVFSIPRVEEKSTALVEQLRTIHSPEVALNEEFYTCPWELVPDLVAKRSVLLQGGKALVPRSDCASIILNSFRDALESSLERIAREIPFLRDDRLVPLLEALRQCDLDAAMASGSSGNTLLGQLAAADVDKASVHFPLCMQHLHRNLRADRHLKFAGRQQYGLFLKSIGLSLSEALVFWRAAFLPKYSADQFNKDYAYNVRHNYGQEGKRANYSSYSCGKICSGSGAPPGEYHGCPFKHAGSPDRLANILSLHTGPNGVKLTAPQIKEVVALAVDGSHYQLACTRVFEMTRPKPGNSPVETITYPHKYYETSLQSMKK